MTETKKPTADDLKQLDDRVARLGQEHAVAKAEFRAAALAHWGCKIGDTVRENKGRRPRTGIIHAVEYISGVPRYKPWVTVRLLKKDGTPGERIVSFYDDWERVEDSATEAA